jgi:hypothetical protein
MTKRSTGNEMMDRPPSSDSGKDMGFVYCRNIIL